MFDVLTVKELQITVGKWCKLLRKKEGLSQQELAERLAVARLTIAKLENGDNVTVDTLFKVLQHFEELNSVNAFVTDKINNLNIQSLY